MSNLEEDDKNFIKIVRESTSNKEAILTVELGEEVEETILNWAKAQIGKGYGWKDVMDEAVHDDIFKPSNMDCSHFVSKALAQGEFFITRKPFYQNTPADVYNCVGLTLKQ